MGRPYTGKKCVSRIKVPQKNGDIYVYERTTSYDRKLKKTVIEGKKLIGKILAGSDEIVPTRAKKPSKKKQSVNKNSASVVTNLPGDAGVANEAGHLNEEASTADASASTNTPPSAAKPPVVAAVRHRIGAVEILKWAGAESGITEALKKNFDIGDAQKINTIAYYWICTDGQSLPRLEGWQVTHPTPYAKASPRTFADAYLPRSPRTKTASKAISRKWQKPSATARSSPLTHRRSTPIPRINMKPALGSARRATTFPPSSCSPSWKLPAIIHLPSISSLGTFQT